MVWFDELVGMLAIPLHILITCHAKLVVAVACLETPNLAEWLMTLDSFR